ncbi:MAG: gliding motility lipoprotein GldH [Prevotella sp.]|nr:gliding motility lipoprotein GldH [Prevotella sp.]
MRSLIKHSLAAVAAAALLTGMAACNRKTVYDHYSHTPVAGWERNDTLSFDIKPMAAGGEYREEVGLRINDAYPFMGLSLVIEQTILPAHLIRSDTLNCKLIDEHGTVKGHGISTYQYNFHLTTLTLNEGDSLHIAVRHNMKREILPGISDIGIRLSQQ